MKETGISHPRFIALFRRAVGIGPKRYCRLLRFRRACLSIHLHVDDADAMIRRAVAEGAELERESSDAFYGERSGVVRDPFGHRWMLGHSIEDVEPDEMQRRYTEMMS